MYKVALTMYIALLTGCAVTHDTNVDLSSNVSKASYSIGHQTGKNFKSSLEERGLDVDAFMAALNTTVSGNSELLLTDEEMETADKVFKETVAQQEKEERERISEKNKNDGDKFRSNYANKEGVKTLSSGLLYEILNEGNGASHPSPDDIVLIHYHGEYINGETFDSSIETGQPIKFPVNKVIPGWQEALQKMSVGERWRVVVPPDLAYGEAGAGKAVEPNTTFIFEIELLEINPSNS